MRTLGALFVLLALVGSPRGVSAQTTSEDRKLAIELFEESERRYRDGEFAAAAMLLREAYEIDPAPTLLYNLARALESEGDLEGAVEAYRRYVKAEPDARDRIAIDKRIENIERQIAEREALEARLEAAKKQEVAPPPPPPPPVVVVEPDEVVVGSPAPWIVAGIGGAVVVSGAVLGVLASGRHGEAESAAAQLDAQNLADEAGGLATGANVAFVAGGVIIGAGLVWGISQLLGEETVAAKDGTGVVLAF